MLVKGGEIVAARIDWGEGLRPGLVADARLTAKAAGTRRGVARFADGCEALVEALAPAACEGQTLRLRITRAAIAESGRYKLAQARPAPDRPARPAPTLFEMLRATDYPVRVVAPLDNAFSTLGWDELLEQGQTGTVTFAGGSLSIDPTRAMTLIDVDGTLPPRALALAAVRPIVTVLDRLDIGGSVGIDFPSLADRGDRQAVDAALAAALGERRAERTAMNGFGFVQLVSRLERPSLVALLARREDAAARQLLRRAERIAEPGAIELTASPGVRRAVRAEWQAELARRTGRRIVWRDRPALDPTVGFAQAVVS